MAEVSIIIPNYNKGVFLDDTIKSCLHQGLDIVKEIIIVDDHSTDDSWPLIVKYSEDYPSFIKIFKNPKKGAASARNYGLSKSEGKYIQWLDSDDILGENKIRIQLDFLKNNNRQLCHCKWVRFCDHVDNLIGGYGPHANIRKSMYFLDFLYEEFNMVALHAWLAEKALYEKVGGWDECLTYNDDGEYMCRTISLVKKIDYVDNAIVFYRSNLNSSLSTLDSRKLESFFKSIESFENLILSFRTIENDRPLTIISNKYYAFIHSTFQYRSVFRDLAYSKIKLYGKPDLTQYINSSKFGFLYKLFGWKMVEFLKVKRSFWLAFKSKYI